MHSQLAIENEDGGDGGGGDGDGDIYGGDGGDLGRGGYTEINRRLATDLAWRAADGLCLRVLLVLHAQVLAWQAFAEIFRCHRSFVVHAIAGARAVRVSFAKCFDPVTQVHYGGSEHMHV